MSDEDPSISIKASSSVSFRSATPRSRCFTGEEEESRQDGVLLTSIVTNSGAPSRPLSSPRACRICFEDEREENLVSPCKCRGSQAYVHVQCLRKWQRSVLQSENASRGVICSVCCSAFDAPYTVESMLLEEYGTHPLWGHLVKRLLSSLPLMHSLGLVKSVLFMILSFFLPYALLAYYGLALVFISQYQPAHTNLGIGVPNLSAGQLLIASHHMPQSSIFHQSVILLLQSDERGARGVILNKPLPEGWKDLRLTSRRGYSAVGLGGPLQLENVIRIKKSPQQERQPLSSSSQSDLVPGLSIDEATSSFLLPKVNTDEVQAGSKPSALLFLGSAGWAPRQLEMEFFAGHWSLCSARATVILEAQSKRARLWEELASGCVGDVQGPGDMEVGDEDMSMVYGGGLLSNNRY